jgi:hypothetical protein
MWALSLPSLEDVPGFLVTIEGLAPNDPTRYFIGGTVLQKPGLSSIGNSIVAGFGGHCDGFNFTGMLVAVSKTSGGTGVTKIVAMEASPGKQSQWWIMSLNPLIDTDDQVLRCPIAAANELSIWEGWQGRHLAVWHRSRHRLD